MNREVMSFGEGRKAVYFGQDKPSLAEMIQIATEVFPDTPFEQLSIYVCDDGDLYMGN